MLDVYVRDHDRGHDARGHGDRRDDQHLGSIQPTFSPDGAKLAFVVPA